MSTLISIVIQKLKFKTTYSESTSIQIMNHWYKSYIAIMIITIVMMIRRSKDHDQHSPGCYYPQNQHNDRDHRSVSSKHEYNHEYDHNDRC